MKIIKKVFYNIIENFRERTVFYGIIDNDENVKFDFKYKDIRESNLVDNQKYIYAIDKNDKPLWIDLDGNEYEIEYMPNYIENRAVAYSVSTGKCGYIDCDKNKTSQFIYDEVYDYRNGYGEVEIEGKHGLIDLDGQEVIPCEYDNIEEIYSKTFFKVLKEDSYYIINDKNNIIAEFYPGESFLEDKLQFKLNDLVQIDTMEDIYVDFNYETIGLYDDGNYQLFNSDGIKIADNGVATCVSDESSEEKFLKITNDRLYMIDKNGETIFEYDKIVPVTYITQNRFIISNNEWEKYGIVDNKGNIIVNPEYDEILPMTASGLYLSVEKDGKYGMIDTEGNVIIECSNKYKDVIVGNDEYFVTAKTDIRLGIIFIDIIAYIQEKE